MELFQVLPNHEYQGIVDKGNTVRLHNGILWESRNRTVLTHLYQAFRRFKPGHGKHLVSAFVPNAAAAVHGVNVLAAVFGTYQIQVENRPLQFFCMAHTGVADNQVLAFRKGGKSRKNLEIVAPLGRLTVTKKHSTFGKHVAPAQQDFDSLGKFRHLVPEAPTFLEKLDFVPQGAQHGRTFDSVLGQKHQVGTDRLASFHGDPYCLKIFFGFSSLHKKLSHKDFHISSVFLQKI